MPSFLATLMTSCLQLFQSGVKSASMRCPSKKSPDALTAATGIFVLDAKGVYDALQKSSSTALELTEERSGIELLGLADSVEKHDKNLRFCHSEIQLADVVTKKKKMSCRIL